MKCLSWFSTECCIMHEGQKKVCTRNSKRWYIFTYKFGHFWDDSFQNWAMKVSLEMIKLPFKGHSLKKHFNFFFGFYSFSPVATGKFFLLNNFQSDSYTFTLLGNTLQVIYSWVELPFLDFDLTISYSK